MGPQKKVKQKRITAQRLKLGEGRNSSDSTTLSKTELIFIQNLSEIRYYLQFLNHHMHASGHDITCTFYVYTPAASSLQYEMTY